MKHHPTFQLAPPPEEISKVFALCMKIRMASVSFILKTEELSRLGLNAEIAALRLKTSAKTISVVVQEVGVLAERIKTVLTELANKGSSLAKEAMGTTAKSHLCKKYTMAWEKGVQGKTKDLLFSEQNAQVAKMKSQLKKLGEQFEYHEAELSKLSRLTIHIPIVSLLIKINASERVAKKGKDQFQDMADSMEKFSLYVREKVEEIINKIHAGTQLLAELSR